MKNYFGPDEYDDDFEDDELTKEDEDDLYFWLEGYKDEDDEFEDDDDFEEDLPY